MMKAYKETKEARQEVAIGYARVSTALQEAEGYSLEAQREAIDRYCAYEGIELIDTFYEVESGRKNDRAIVNEVLNLCELKNAKLVVARLDRFSRDVHFLTKVQKRSISFIAVDNPSADSMVLQILVSVAENESRIIGTRTKSALAVAKANGVELGSNKTILATYQRCKDQTPKEWKKYVRLRLWFDRYLKSNKKLWNAFKRDMEPMYEFVDLSHGWTEMVEKAKVGKNHHGDDEYWEEWSEKLGEDWFGQEQFLSWARRKYSLWFYRKPTLATLKPISDSWEITFEGKTRNIVDEIEGQLALMSANNTLAPTKARVDKARKDALKFKPIIKKAKKEGHTSIRKLGAYLEENRFKTPSGKDKWGVSSVQSLLKVIEDAETNAPVEMGSHSSDWYSEKRKFVGEWALRAWERKETQDALLPNGNWGGYGTQGEFIPEDGLSKQEFIERTAHSIWRVSNGVIKAMQQSFKI